ncbi:MAG: hypothetical protein QG607_130 [Patescibacteria group bacterium]|nr:hypothetical protein [Patescibacteria group bacterium]
MISQTHAVWQLTIANAGKMCKLIFYAKKFVHEIITHMRTYLFSLLFFILFSPFSVQAAELPEVAVASALFKSNGDIQVTAKNMGAAATVMPVTVSAYWFDQDDDYLYKTDFVTVGPVDVATFSQITIGAAQIPKKAVRAIFYADPTNKIKEVNEWNNEFGFVFPAAKFEAIKYVADKNGVSIVVKNVGEREYAPESCLLCIGKKYARVVWRSADALQDLSDVLETSLIPAPLGPGAEATISFTKYIPKNATFLVVDVYQYNSEDWMNNFCVMCDSLKASPTRMFIPVAQRADIAITGVSFDAVSGVPTVTIKNISEIPLEMENAGQISWAYFYENGEMKNSKFGKMDFSKTQILPGVSFDIPLPADAKLSYGISKMMVVYDTSRFFNPMSVKIIEENVILHNKESDVKNNIWTGGVPQPELKIASATLEKSSVVRLVFANEGAQGFELCDGFSLCGRKFDIDYYNGAGKLVAKNQGTINAPIKAGQTHTQEFLLDSSVNLLDLSLIRITHDFGSEKPSEKNGRIANIYVTEKMVSLPSGVVDPSILESFASNFKLFFAFTPEQKARALLGRTELLSRRVAAAEERRDVEKIVAARKDLREAAQNFSEIKREDRAELRRATPEISRMIEEESPKAQRSIQREVEVEGEVEIEHSRVSTSTAPVRVIEKKREVQVIDREENEEEDIVVEREVEKISEPVRQVQIPEWQKFRQEQIEAIDKAYSEVVARKNRLTGRENTRISAEWAAAQDLFERARRSMSEFVAVERQQELFTRVQIDAARQLKIMDGLVH